MRFNVLALLVASCLYVAMAQVSYEDCCLKYDKKLNGRTQRMAVHYRVQQADGGCNIPAVIFTMKKGRLICSDPKEPWVLRLMRAIDKRTARNGKTKHGRHVPKRG
ncbi:C-C motif chemokine 25 [Genypterus blacodes]|uniref:C-C motif chemokine 25 n=1 Tax=Genypterus blacodes TaxID=154954 RepID=UPI003F76F7FD